MTASAHLAARINQTPRITLSERPLQIDRLNTLAPCVAENRERRALPIVAVWIILSIPLHVTVVAARTLNPIACRLLYMSHDTITNSRDVVTNVVD